MLTTTVVAMFAFAPAPSMALGLATRTVILTYHDIIRERDADSVWFDCTVEEFESQLDWLADQGAHFVSLDQLHRHLTTGSGLPNNPVAITFADNYLGFYQFALPILRERKIPVTMFVHTDYVGSTQGRDKMSWDQLVELDREGLVTIASQTRSHPPDLRTLSPSELHAEFSGSKAALEAKLNHPVRFLAYPNGKFDAKVAEEAKRAGYWAAFTEEQRPAEDARDMFTIPRWVHTKYREAFPRP